MKAKKKTSTDAKQSPLSDAELSKAVGGTFASNTLGSFIPQDPVIPVEPFIPVDPVKQFKTTALRRRLR